jgi:hypothetical protein
MRKTLALISALGVLVAALIVGPAANSSRAADHLDAPTVKLDGRIDINDVYVFHPGSPGAQNLNRTVLVMTVNPGAGVLEKSSTFFSPHAVYEFLIDTNGDAKPNIIVRARFSAVRNNKQNVTVRWVTSNSNRVIAQGQTEKNLNGKDNSRVFAGLRDDPFFFDLANFNKGATFCGATGGLPVSDFFLGLNLTAIVVQVPTSWIGKQPVGVWARTLGARGGDDDNDNAVLQADRDDDAKQLDRMGRPAILTVFIPPNPFEPGPDAIGNAEDRFNFTKPHQDQRRWRGEIINTLLALGNSQDRANALADVLLPDILTVDLSQETAFLNGRNLGDDVIDAELALLTNGAITTDCIDNDSTFLDRFPYLGVPN